MRCVGGGWLVQPANLQQCDSLQQGTFSNLTTATPPPSDSSASMHVGSLSLEHVGSLSLDVACFFLADVQVLGCGQCRVVSVCSSLFGC